MFANPGDASSGVARSSALASRFMDLSPSLTGRRSRAGRPRVAVAALDVLLDLRFAPLGLGRSLVGLAGLGGAGATRVHALHRLVAGRPGRSLCHGASLAGAARTMSWERAERRTGLPLPVCFPTRFAARGVLSGVRSWPPTSARDVGREHNR